MLRYILDVFKYVGKVGKNTLLNPLIRLKYSFTRKTNVKLILADFVKKRIKAIQKFLLGKPGKLEDYVEFKRFYVAKSLIIIVLILCIALPILFYIFAVPFLVQKFGTASFIQTSEEVRTYSGKVRIYTEEKELVYKGELKEGIRQGKGELYDSDGNLVYRGAFAEGLKEGEGVEYYSGGGVKLRGLFKAGSPEGLCIQYYENGKVMYEGSFLLGQYNGNGKLYGSSGTLLYEGLFQNGEFSGTGVLYRENGERLYEGEFKNGKYYGNGILYDSNRDIEYEGAFVDGSYHGTGRLYENGVLLYDGEFVKGEFSGKGKLYGSSGAIIYEGDFKNGKYSGKGILYNKAGRVIYDGPFFDGDINYAYLLGLPSDDIRNMFGKKYETLMLEDGFCLASNDLGLSVYLNFADIDVESLSQELIVSGERRVFGVDPTLTMTEIKKILGEPLSFGKTEIRDRERMIAEPMKEGGVYKAEYLLDEYAVRFYFASEDGGWKYAVIGGV